jgi:fumarate reductase flavoprotein subunit
VALGEPASAVGAAVPVSVDVDVDIDVDVVVVGAGLAGSAAALAAAQSGATVCLLEKGHAAGGSSVKAGGGLLFAGTSLQRQHGVADSAKSLRQAIMAAGSDRNDPAAVDVYVDNQLAVYDWLTGLGQAFSLAPPNGDISVRRLHTARPGELTRLLLERFAATGRGQLLTQASAQRLIARDGRVTGIRASQAGRGAPGTPRRGVILATGGFTQSLRLLRTFAPGWADAVAMGGDGNTGDGLLMAMACGAQLSDMGYIEGTFGASAVDFPGLPAAAGTAPRLLFPHSAGAIIVSGAGRRFVNEGLGYKAIAGIWARQQDPIAFQVFDQQVMDKSVPVPSPRDFAAALADGLIFRAPTLAALAGLLRVEPAALEDTVAAYNGYVRAGADPEHGRPLEAAVPIAAPPFYGYPCRAGLTTTYCGVRVNRRLQVLNVFDEPIGGLFAAGEVVGGLHGAGYLTGTGLGKAAVFGRVAGLEAAG